MPFKSTPLSLETFRPDDDFDPNEDLMQVTCEDQHLYVSNINGIWGVRITDPTIAPSMVAALRAQEHSLPRPLGIRVDSASIGSFALFSAAGYDWSGIWRSDTTVTDLSPVRRSDINVSDIVVVENRPDTPKL